jgi:hypothetical protein
MEKLDLGLESLMQTLKDENENKEDLEEDGDEEE